MSSLFMKIALFSVTAAIIYRLGFVRERRKFISPYDVWAQDLGRVTSKAWLKVHPDLDISCQNCGLPAMEVNFFLNPPMLVCQHCTGTRIIEMALGHD